MIKNMIPIKEEYKKHPESIIFKIMNEIEVINKSVDENTSTEKYNESMGAIKQLDELLVEFTGCFHLELKMHNI